MNQRAPGLLIYRFNLTYLVATLVIYDSREDSNTDETTHHRDMSGFDYWFS